MDSTVIALQKSGYGQITADRSSGIINCQDFSIIITRGKNELLYNILQLNFYQGMNDLGDKIYADTLKWNEALLNSTAETGILNLSNEKLEKGIKPSVEFIENANGWYSVSLSNGNMYEWKDVTVSMSYNVRPGTYSVNIPAMNARTRLVYSLERFTNQAKNDNAKLMGKPDSVKIECTTVFGRETVTIKTDEQPNK